MNSTQTNLFKQRDTLSDLPSLIGALRGRGWVKAAVLKETGWEERQLRSCAEASDGEIISGQKGYCLLEEATLPEIKQSSSWMISQGRKMVNRGLRQLRKVHTQL